MSFSKNLFILSVFFLILLGGTLGYHLIEGWSLFDSFYMTVITITTVGFQEIHPLGVSGRILTIVLLFSGLGTAFFVLSNLTVLLFQGEIRRFFGRRAMHSEIAKKSGHLILAGYGRTGQMVAHYLLAKKFDFVVIDNEAEKMKPLTDRKVPHIVGDASDEAVLKQAGIERAKGFISVVSDDATNTFAVMTARGLNPKLNIVSRAVFTHSVPKLKLAGANRVISPYHLSATRIAQAVTSPTVVDFVEVLEDTETKDIELADVKIETGSALDGAFLNSDAVKSLGIIVIGIKDHMGQFTFQPSGTTRIHANHHLVVVGPSDALMKAAKCAEA